MQKKMRLKKFVIPSLYVILFVTVLTGAILISRNLKANTPSDDMDFVSDIVTSEEEPVINEEKEENTSNKMLKPYTNEKVTVGKSYYDYKGESASQEKSITYYDGSYIQNSGIDYTLEEVFDVVSVLDGTVEEVKDDDILGKTIQIKHGNNFVSTYQSLSEFSVKKGDTVTQGQVIGKSGTNKLDKDMGNHLHFELYTNGQIVDPSLYIDKEIKNQ